MYFIINKTKQTTTQVKGNFPDLDSLLDKGDRIIVISTYSNTIKVPYFEELNGIKEWEWEDFPFDINTLNLYKHG